MKINELLSEMAAPSANILAKTYYHGTHDHAAAENILTNGIQPPDLSLRKGLLKPVVGKVYCTDKLGYAQIYAIGGDIAGSDVDIRRYINKHGYIFVIPGSGLKDVQPDEDSIGSFLHDILRYKNNRDMNEMSNRGRKLAIAHPEIVDHVYNMAHQFLSAGTLWKVEEGLYAYWEKLEKYW